MCIRDRLAVRSGVPSHVVSVPSNWCEDAASDAAALGWPAAVVGDGRDVLDERHLEAVGLQGADRGLATGPGALDEDVDLANAVLRGGLGGLLRGELRSEGRGLAAALVAHVARRRPRQDIALLVGDRHDRVVERALDVRLAIGDLTTFLLAGPLCLGPAVSYTHLRAHETV